VICPKRLHSLRTAFPSCRIELRPIFTELHQQHHKSCWLTNVSPSPYLIFCHQSYGYVAGPAGRETDVSQGFYLHMSTQYRKILDHGEHGIRVLCPICERSKTGRALCRAQALSLARRCLLLLLPPLLLLSLLPLHHYY
jgi:hypothetical protein